VIAALVLVLAPGNAVAGPWTVAEGEVVASLTHIRTEFDHFFNRNREQRQLLGPVRHRDTVLTLTYGFVDDWEAVGQFSRYESEKLFPGDEAAQSGSGDTRLAVKHLTRGGAFDLATQAGIKWAGSYDADVIYAPGDGQTDIELRMLGGKFWDRAFVDIEVAYRFRTGAPADEYEVLVDTGYAISSWLHGRLFSRMVDARTGVGSADVPSVVLKQTEEDAVSVGGSLAVQPLAGLAVTLQYTTVVAGRNTPVRSDIGVGVAYSFDFFLD
jgi:hypothetical protein